VKPTKKVVDAGALRSPEFEAYLKASANNFAVICDFAVMEAFKGNATINLRKSFEMAGRYPNQIILLKSIREIASLDPKSKGLQNRLVSQKQTAGFPDFCRALYGDSTGNSHINRVIAAKEDQVHKYFSYLTGRVDRLRLAIAEILQRYPPEEIKRLRSGMPFSPGFAGRMVEDILTITAKVFYNAVGESSMPSMEAAMFSFQFRYSLCTYSLVLKWIMKDGYNNVSNDKLRNDFIDMVYAAYATFFDGIITKDKKLLEIYQFARWLIDEVVSKWLVENAARACTRPL
jgi:hypothetical protein